MRLHYVFVFSWDKWVSEINEQSPRPKQIKHKSSSRRNAANMVTRLWGEHEFFERTARGRFIMNLNRKMLYLSGITWAMQPKATCVWYLSFSVRSHFSRSHFIILLHMSSFCCFQLQCAVFSCVYSQISIQHHLPYVLPNITTMLRVQKNMAYIQKSLVFTMTPYLIYSLLYIWLNYGSLIYLPWGGLITILIYHDIYIEFRWKSWYHQNNPLLPKRIQKNTVIHKCIPQSWMITICTTVFTQLFHGIFHLSSSTMVLP